MSPDTTRQHILEAAIAAIEKYGVQNLTTRLIAQEAGVNNAALHYYYGTKEHLVSEALGLALDHMMEDVAEIMSRPQELRLRLEVLLEYLIIGGQKFPNVLRSHLAGPLMDGQADSPLVQQLDVLIEQAARELPPQEQALFQSRLYTTLAGVMATALIPTRPGKPTDLPLADPAARSKYVASLVESLLVSH